MDSSFLNLYFDLYFEILTATDIFGFCCNLGQCISSFSCMCVIIFFFHYLKQFIYLFVILSARLDLILQSENLLLKNRLFSKRFHPKKFFMISLLVFRRSKLYMTDFTFRAA